jgi:hypothetical protein
VNDDDEEQTQLKALQTTLTVLQSHHGITTDASVSAVVVTGFRLLSGTQPTNAVHATAAATLRQAVSVLLARAREDVRACPRAVALLRVLCSLARGAAAPDLAAPLPRAFAVDLLDDAMRAHAPLFSAVPAFNELLLQCVFPLLDDLLSSDTAVGAALSARLSAGALHGVAPSASALADDVGFDPAEVAERRCAFRTAATAACTYAQSLPQQTDALLERVLAASQSSSAAPWYRAAALDALQRCAADQRVARALVEAVAPVTPRVRMLTQMSKVAADVLADAFGADAVRKLDRAYATPVRRLSSARALSLPPKRLLLQELNMAEATLQAVSSYFEARAKGQEVRSRVYRSTATACFVQHSFAFLALPIGCHGRG